MKLLTKLLNHCWLVFAMKGKMKGGDILIDFGDGLSYLYHKLSLNCGVSCTGSPGWIKSRKRQQTL